MSTEKDIKQKSNAMRYVGWASQMMATLAVATWLGWFFDEKIAWNFPLFIIILPLVALIYSLWKLIKEVSKQGK